MIPRWNTHGLQRLAATRRIRTTAKLAEQFDVHPNQITSWNAQLEGGAADIFGPGGGNGATQPTVDVKSPQTRHVSVAIWNDAPGGCNQLLCAPNGSDHSCH